MATKTKSEAAAEETAATKMTATEPILHNGERVPVGSSFNATAKQMARHLKKKTAKKA